MDARLYTSFGAEAPQIANQGKSKESKSIRYTYNRQIYPAKWQNVDDDESDAFKKFALCQFVL